MLNEREIRICSLLSIDEARKRLNQKPILKWPPPYQPWIKLTGNKIRVEGLYSNTYNPIFSAELIPKVQGFEIKGHFGIHPLFRVIGIIGFALSICFALLAIFYNHALSVIPIVFVFVWLLHKITERLFGLPEKRRILGFLKAKLDATIEE